MAPPQVSLSEKDTCEQAYNIKIYSLMINKIIIVL